MDRILELKNLATGYMTKREKKVVTEGINAELNRGELVCLIGPNGAGKSTLMRTISGTQKPLRGEVFLNGTNIYGIPPRDLAKKLSLVLTERVNAGMLSAYEVVALGRYPHTNWSGKLSQSDHRIIEEAIEMAGATELAERSLSELSDGERQKIMVARAFAQEPEVMILDEVTAFLDLPRRVEIMKLLRNMANQSGKCILLSTHDMDLALRSSDRIWLLPKGERLQIGSPEDLILDGNFERAFSSEGVSFDLESGSFRIHNEYQWSVSVEGGSGAVRQWTRRAMERIGVRVEENAPRRVIVETEGDMFTWKLIDENEETSCASIHELVTALKRQEVPEMV